MRKSLLSREQRQEADQWIEDNFCFIDPTDIGPDNKTVEANLKWVLDRAGDAVFRHGIRFLLIDPWNQIEHARARGEGEHDYQLRAIRAVKAWARRYDVATIVVAHPNKSVLRPDGKIRKPTLYDISGSAHWHNAADHGLLVWADDQRSRIRTIEVQKSRFHQAGLPGSVQLHLDGRLRAMVAPTPTDSRKREADLDFDA
jgi:twinkle protein